MYKTKIQTISLTLPLTIYFCTSWFDSFQMLFTLDGTLDCWHCFEIYITKQETNLLLSFILIFERRSVVFVRRLCLVKQTVSLLLGGWNIRCNWPQNFRHFANFTETFRDAATSGNTGEKTEIVTLELARV